MDYEDSGINSMIVLLTLMILLGALTYWVVQ